MNATQLSWKVSDGLYKLQANGELKTQIENLLKKAKQKSVDLICFPELSIPEDCIQVLQSWSLDQKSIVIGGSHYLTIDQTCLSRCPVIIDGEVAFVEKINPSFLEKSPIHGTGLSRGSNLLRFNNTRFGNIGVLICSDFLDTTIINDLDLDTLDILCVPSFQRKSYQYFQRMNILCENSKRGIYILYANFIDAKFGDGNSSLFGQMDRVYTQKLESAGITDRNPETKLAQLSSSANYLIADLNLFEKRPFANHNLDTDPNVVIVESNLTMIDPGNRFIQKIAHDDERYRRIDDYFVPPKEYDEILEILKIKNFVVIIGDPGIGKTYTAAKLLKLYNEKGYEPIWFSGLEKEEREAQTRMLTTFSASEKQVIYFEDPFGRTAFERRDILFQIFSPLIDSLHKLDCKVIITSRKEIFETFQKESLLAEDLVDFKAELNIRKPSYEIDDLLAIFKNLIYLNPDWANKEELIKAVRASIQKGDITTPLAIRDLIYSAKNINSQEDLLIHISKRTIDTVRLFAQEIANASAITQSVLYFVFFVGLKGRAFLFDQFFKIFHVLKNKGVDINASLLNDTFRSQIGYRIEQMGNAKTIYKFSHPVYEEALAELILKNGQCQTIAKGIITELMSQNSNQNFAIVNRIVSKYPEATLLLLEDMLQDNQINLSSSLRLEFSRRLISIYFSTKKEGFFEMAIKFFSEKEAINAINQQSQDTAGCLDLIKRYVFNSPITKKKTDITLINWERVFTNKYIWAGGVNRIFYVLSISATFYKNSIFDFIGIHGLAFLKRAYFLLEGTNRVHLYNLAKGTPLHAELKRYKEKIEFLETSNINPWKYYIKVIFSEKEFFGYVKIDRGASNALKRWHTNLLPIGIVSVDGDFNAGDIVAIKNEYDYIIGVGVCEYSSNDLRKIMGQHSWDFPERLGFFHATAAIKREFLLLFNRRKDNRTLNWRFNPTIQSKD